MGSGKPIPAENINTFPKGLVQALLDRASAATAVRAEEDGFLRVNTAFLRLFKLPEKAVFEQNSPEFRKALSDFIENPEDIFKPSSQAFDGSPDLRTRSGMVISQTLEPLGKTGSAELWTFALHDQAGLFIPDSRDQAILKSVFENSQDGILVVDFNMRMIAWNQKYLETFNLTSDFIRTAEPREVIAYSLAQIKTHEQTRLRKEINEMVSDPSVDLRNILYFKDGRIVERFTEVLSNGERQLGRVLYYRDITDSTRRIEELIARTRELDRFVYSASHEMKSPMNSLMGLIDLLQPEVNGEDGKSYLELMERSIAKMDLYIQNLEKFSQNENEELVSEPLELEELIGEAIRACKYLEKPRKPEYEIRINTEEEFFSCSSRFRIILFNLISNSVKFQDPDKKTPRVSIEIDAKPGNLSLSVRDNGIGIPEEHKDKIFDLYFRATHRAFGSGLGLYVTRKTVRKLQGELSVDSREGIGTRFVLRLPELREETTN